MRYTVTLCCLLSLLLLPALCLGSPDQRALQGAIVKVYTVINSPDYYRPWQQKMQQASASGFIIDHHRILTNAHVVANHTFLEVRRNGQARRFTARLLNVSHEADLALLTVDDDGFFAGIAPLKLGGLPELQQEVTVYGFPTGGDTLSITKGIVSRVEHVTYSHSGLSFLGGQIDAAINPGNSGGPVLTDGRVVGVAMQGRVDADNIGYLIPVPVIRHFLTDIDDGRYDGFPDPGVITQELRNSDMKKRYGMSDDQTGVLITRLLPDSPARGILQEEDIILALDDYPVADNGTILFRDNERTSYGYITDRHQIGDQLTVTLLRDGSLLTRSLTLSLRADQQMYGLLDSFDTLPRYIIYGGIVFSPLSKNLLRAWGKNFRSRAPDLTVALTDLPNDQQTEAVVALMVLAADVNRGYHQISNRLITRINDQPYHDFADFCARIDNAKGQYISFTDRRHNRIVLDRDKVRQSHAAILQQYRIPADRFLGTIDGH